MVKLQRKSAQNTQPTLSEIAKDPQFLKAADKISNGQKNLLKLIYGTE